MECSWIMVWLPTKQRESIFKKKSKIHKTESARKIQRVFSTGEPSSQNADEKEVIECSSKKDELKDKCVENIKEETEENSRFNVEKLTSDAENKSTSLNSNQSNEKEHKLDKRISDVSTRFQIQRQNTEVLAKEKEDTFSKISDSNTLEKQKERDHEEDEDEEVFKRVESYTERIEKILIDLNVNATSLRTKDDAHILVTFCLENSKVENVLLLLQENGIGNSPSETSISVIPASVHFEVPLADDLNNR